MARYLAQHGGHGVLIAVSQIVLALPAGFALAKLEFVGRRTAFGLVLVCLLIPAQATFVPVFLMLGAASGSPTPWRRSSFPSAPARSARFSFARRALHARRAHRSGAARRRERSTHRLPTARAGAAADAGGALSPELRLSLERLLLAAGDDTDDRIRTVPVGIALLREQGTGVRWHVVMAGNVILSAPILVVFAIAQRHLVRAVATRGF